MTGSRGLACGCLVAALAAPSWAATARVVDVTGQPVAGAKACSMTLRVETRCATVDAAGTFELATEGTATVRVIADDFVPQVFPVAGLPAVVTLVRTPTLFVRLKDAVTGLPISGGEVFVVFPTGERRGPFTTNAAGVRVRRVLEPGEIRVVVDKPGYRSGRAAAVTLEAGKESALELALVPDPANAR